MMSIFACDRWLNVTPNFRCYNLAYEKELFSYRMALIFPQLLNELCVVLSVFFIFECKSFSDIAKKYSWTLNVLTGKPKFVKE